MCLCSRMVLLTHCWTDTSTTSEDWIANWEPYQQALEKGQCKKRWVADSSSESHRGHRPTLVIPLLFRVWKVGRLSWRSLQIQLHIFKGTLTFQRTFHTAAGGGVVRGMNGILQQNLVSFFDFVIPWIWVFPHKLSATTPVFDKGIPRISLHKGNGCRALTRSDF